MVVASATWKVNRVGCTRSIPVTVSGCRHRLGDREAGLLGDQRLRLARRLRRKPVRWPAVRRPSPPTANPARRKPRPVRDRHDRPPADTALAVGDLAQRRRSARRGVRRSPRCGPCGAHAGAPRCRRGPAARRRLCSLFQPVGQPPRGAGAARRQKSSDSGNSSGAGHRGRRPRCGVSGACSRTACTLVPDIPNDDDRRPVAARRPCRATG